MLTDKEKKMIENLINNEYESGLDAVPWAFTLHDGYITGNKFGLNEYKGVLGSLVKKDLVVIMDTEDDGNSDDHAVYLTNKGKDVAFKLYNKKYDWL